MDWIEKLLAGFTIAVCVVLLVRLLLPRARRQSFDRGVKRIAAECQMLALSGWRWRSARQRAARAAEEAILRARRDARKSARPPQELH